jgi:hypothetical protein
MASATVSSPSKSTTPGGVLIARRREGTTFPPGRGDTSGGSADAGPITSMEGSDA